MRPSSTRAGLGSLNAKWMIRFVVSAFLAALLGAPAAALEAEALGLTSPAAERLSPDSSPAGGVDGLPVLYLYKAPQSSSSGSQPGLMVYGGHADVQGSGLSLSGDLYFGKTVRLADMLQPRSGLAPEATGLMAMSAQRGQDRQFTLTRGRAINQSLGYSSRVFNLTGTYTAVDAQFQGLNELVSERPDVQQFKDALGMESLTLEGRLQPVSALAMETRFSRLVNDQPGHKERGLETTHIVHGLNLAPSDGFGLKGTWDLTQWQGLKEGSLRDVNLSAQLSPARALGLNASYQQHADDKPDSKKRGQTITKTHYDLAYGLSERTQFTAAYDTLQEVWDKPDKQSLSDTATTSLALAHRFGGGTAIKIGHQLIAATKDGQALDTAVNSLHLEHKSGARFGLVGDVVRRSMSDGNANNIAALKVDSGFGSGRSATRLVGEWKRHETGQAGAQQDTLTRLNLTSAANPALQLNVDYTSDRRDGPQARKDYTKTVTTLTSRVTGEAAITAVMLRESDLGQLLTSEQSLKLDFTPGLMKLNSQYRTVGRGSGDDERELTTDLFLELGHPMREWAQQASKKGAFDGVNRYHVMGLAGWADMPQGGVTYQMIKRDRARQEAVDTKRLGYQTMLGPRAYLRLAMQQYPVQKKDNQTVILPIEEQLLEGGVKVGGRFSLLARQHVGRDFEKASRLDTTMLALRGGVGGSDRFAFAGGLQRSRAQGDQAGSRITFGDLRAKIGTPLAAWAQEASSKGLFDDHKTYGHRDLPGWARFTDGGLHLQLVTRSGEQAPSLTTYLAGAQTMLGRRLYLKASMEQNPLNKKNETVLGRRMLYEAGLRFGGKFTALARHLSEHDDTTAKSLRSDYFALRGRLSARERLEAILVFDQHTYPGGGHQQTSYGLEYAREVDDGHYLTVKGIVSHDGDPTKAAAERKAYELDLGFKKAI